MTRRAATMLLRARPECGLAGARSLRRGGGPTLVAPAPAGLFLGLARDRERLLLRYGPPQDQHLAEMLDRRRGER
ncbi:MAG: hypothetical protein ABI585_08310, partial [Betaproteobacteria bacterium]